MLSESAVELAPALLMVAGSLHPKIEYVLSLPILRERAAFKVATVCPSPHRYNGKPPVDDQVRPGWTRVDDDNMVASPPQPAPYRKTTGARGPPQERNARNPSTVPVLRQCRECPSR